MTERESGFVLKMKTHNIPETEIIQCLSFFDGNFANTEHFLKTKYKQ